MEQYTALAPGPPFVFGAFMVVIAILVAVFIPEEPSDQLRRPSGEKKKSSYPSFIFFLFCCWVFGVCFFLCLWMVLKPTGVKVNQNDSKNWVKFVGHSEKCDIFQGLS